jgi:hypothetical protein
MNQSAPLSKDTDDAIDFAELFSRLRQGIPTTLGLGALGLAMSAFALFLAGWFLNVTTESRVIFAFAGYERGEYPDKSKFQPDDLRAPDIVAEALRRLGMDASESSQSKVRAALSVEGLIPANIIKERDKLRAAGQSMRPYIPDEYSISLTLPRKFPLAPQQREQLLNEIVSVYREKFQRTYADLPLAFGNAFAPMEGADYYEYELILSLENQNIDSYLSEMNVTARSFRSPTTNLSFADLLKQSRLFSQIRLNETLGLIRQNGLSKDRKIALMKMDYYLRTLEDQENKALEEEKVIKGLLAGTQERAQSYVLGVKSQAAQPRTDGPILDQGLIDSLLANDANNFLVRQALEAGLKVKSIQAEKAILAERRKNLQSFEVRSESDQIALVVQLDKSLRELKQAYEVLVENIRKTHKDYQQQQYNDTVRLSMQPITQGFYRSLAMAGIAGLGIGLAAGIGLSLLNLVGTRKRA